ncbi:TOBE domain-containing protein [Campylobacter majalis]|uniref:TOBE domain-containing protein n=1 Tax=Campylobacter majalis TaxID=2790656 RepID=UPI001E36AB4A|nr:TOBE domain-containing protein [Campylobacter majalis]
MFLRADVSLELLLGEGVQVVGRHIDLLKAVDKTKSITKAANEVGISYKNAWDTLDIINNKSEKPLISRTSGNKKNSGSELTEYGKKMIQTFENLQNLQREYLANVAKNFDINSLDIKNLNRLSLNLSARNQLNCEICEINEGVLKSQIIARLNGGEKIVATITKQSQISLGLAVGMSVVFIFKAPSVSLKEPSKDGLVGEVSEVKIGKDDAEITLNLSGDQSITAVTSKDEAFDLRVSVGERYEILIDKTDIIIGV